MANRGLVTSYMGGGEMGDAQQLNDNQTFTMYIPPELRRKYESTLLAQVEQVSAVHVGKASP